MHYSTKLQNLYPPVYLIDQCKFSVLCQNILKYELVTDLLFKSGIVLQESYSCSAPVVCVVCRWYGSLSYYRNSDENNTQPDWGCGNNSGAVLHSCSTREAAVTNTGNTHTHPGHYNIWCKGYCHYTGEFKTMRRGTVLRLTANQ